VVEVGGYRGAMIVGGTETFLAILEADLPQAAATTLDMAGAQVVNRLQTLLRERAEQLRWYVLLRSSSLSSKETSDHRLRVVERRVASDRLSHGAPSRSCVAGVHALRCHRDASDDAVGRSRRLRHSR
jgi:hypothetical protein